LRMLRSETAEMSGLDGCRQQYSREAQDGEIVQPARLSGSDVHRSMLLGCRDARAQWFSGRRICSNSSIESRAGLLSEHGPPRTTSFGWHLSRRPYGTRDSAVRTWAMGDGAACNMGAERQPINCAYCVAGFSLRLPIPFPFADLLSGMTA
jgi:hypothetical protein